MRCPNCGVTENHPTDKDKIVIRAYKLYDSHGAWSQCLMCSGGYDKFYMWNEKNHNPLKGWFCTKVR